MKKSEAGPDALTRSVINFGAGPAMLPEAVLRRAQEELLDWHGLGISVIEMSHRSREFLGIVERSVSDLRTLLSIPDGYRILFMPGGATSQFANVPLNLCTENGSADYVCTGHWSKKAADEARRHCTVHAACGADGEAVTDIPASETWSLTPDAAYVFYTANETIGGVEFPFVPDTGAVPLVSDMTSSFLSRPLDVSRFGLVFAGAQKNFGPSGICVVIIREDLIGHARAHIPSLCDYRVYADSDSLINTPSTFSWYLAGLMFDWILEQGGVAEMERRTIERAGRLYSAIDDSDWYRNPVAPGVRSRMNVPFTLPDPALDPVFLEEAAGHGLIALKGHRAVGGMRASLYNGMPLSGVERLVDFMQDFAHRHG